MELQGARQKPWMPTSTLRPPGVCQPATSPPGCGPASSTSTAQPLLARCHAAPSPALTNPGTAVSHMAAPVHLLLRLSQLCDAGKRSVLQLQHAFC